MLEVEYNMTLVVISYAIAVFGSFTALNLAIRIPSADTAASLFGWLSMAAIALGGGAVWSMHFIGMLAYDSKMPVSYDVVLTIASMLLAIIVSGVGLLIVGRGTSSIAKLIMAGTITGLGVAGMHYTGMAAMDMPATMSYDTPLLVASIVIAIAAATVALWLAFNLRGGLQRFGSAFVMGVAVCGMHYTGMAALQMTPTGEAMGKVAANNVALPFYIVMGASTVLFIFLMISLLKSGGTQELAFGD